GAGGGGGGRGRAWPGSRGRGRGGRGGVRRSWRSPVAGSVEGRLRAGALAHRADVLEPLVPPGGLVGEPMLGAELVGEPALARVGLVRAVVVDDDLDAALVVGLRPLLVGVELADQLAPCGVVRGGAGRGRVLVALVVRAGRGRGGRGRHLGDRDGRGGRLVELGVRPPYGAAAAAGGVADEQLVGRGRVLAAVAAGGRVHVLGGRGRGRGVVVDRPRLVGLRPCGQRLDVR